MPTSMFDISGPNYGLKRVKIGTYNAGSAYTNIIQVPSVQMFGVTIKVQTAELEGNDRITDSHGRAQKGTARLRFGSVNTDVLRVITGQTYTSSGSTPNRVRQQKFKALGFPYFGIVGLSESTNALGALVVFSPKAKVVSDFAIAELEYGKYSIPDLTVDLIGDEYYGNLATTEVQTVTLTSATGGTFTLTFGGSTTSALAFDATNTTVDTALEALASIGTGNVVVTGSAGGPYTITFAGTLAEQNVPAITADGASLTGSGHSIAVAQTTQGVDPTETILEIIPFETAPLLLTLPPTVS